MVLYKLHGGRQIGLVELVGDVPADGAKLPAFLHCGMEEAHAVQHGFPLRHVGDVQLLLADQAVRTLQARLHALRRLVGELDGRLHNKMITIL